MLVILRAVNIDLLIVAAHPPELEGLTPILGAGLEGRVGEVTVLARPVGIGIPASAAGTGALIQRVAPRAVVLVGTCGAYDSGDPELAIGHVVVGRRLHLVSSAVVEGRSDYPGAMPTAIDANGPLAEALASYGHRQVSVATTLGVTTDDALAKRIAESSGCEVEHLEAFAVASACAKEKVPVAVALSVANRVGSRARDEWRRHHLSAGEAVTAMVAAWLVRGAPGVDVKTSR